MSINEFEIDNGVLIKYHGDGGDVTVPYGVEAIGNYAFYDCKNLASMVVPQNVVNIGDSVEVEVIKIDEKDRIDLKLLAINTSNNQ